MVDHIVDITQENAQQYIIEESNKRLVVVDFWADWCEPCKNLMPVLESLASEYQGQFLLAKINADEQQALSGQFGVRSLPTVMLIQNGQPVDGFAGVQTESEVRALLEKYLPKPWDVQLTEALPLIESGDFSAAAAILKPAYENSDARADIALAYVKALLGAKRLEEAGTVISAIKMADQDSEYTQLKAQYELALEAGKSPEIEALEAEHKANPTDQALALKLAVQYAQNDHTKEALELLLTLLRKDLGAVNGEVRKAFTDILQSMEKGDALAAEYQRKLYTLLY